MFYLGSGESLFCERLDYKPLIYLGTWSIDLRKVSRRSLLTGCQVTWYLKKMCPRNSGYVSPSILLFSNVKFKPRI
jgi:hypothetical protein